MLVQGRLFYKTTRSPKVSTISRIWCIILVRVSSSSHALINWNNSSNTPKWSFFIAERKKDKVHPRKVPLTNGKNISMLLQKSMSYIESMPLVIRNKTTLYIPPILFDISFSLILQWFFKDKSKKKRKNRINTSFKRVHMHVYSEREPP